jgi:hypothetical protein
MTQIEKMTDRQLQDAVSDELEWTPSVDSSHIGVAADDAAITLTGEVASYPEKRAAEKAVLRVRGVLAMAGDLRARNRCPVQDSDIAREAGEALSRAVDVPADSVQVSVHDHFITLSSRGCPAVVALAPVMMRRSVNFDGCRPNPWPTASEIALVIQLHHLSGPATVGFGAE